jgi:hypothetical protein
MSSPISEELFGPTKFSPISDIKTQMTDVRNHLIYFNVGDLTGSQLFARELNLFTDKKCANYRRVLSKA